MHIQFLKEVHLIIKHLHISKSSVPTFENHKSLIISTAFQKDIYLLNQPTKAMPRDTLGSSLYPAGRNLFAYSALTIICGIGM